MGEVIDINTKKPKKGGARRTKKARVPVSKKGLPAIAGRPSYDFPLDQVEDLARLGCSRRELAVYFHVAESTIDKRMDEDPEFRAAYEKGFTEIQQNIRRAQIELAFSNPALNYSGKATMLIWLGKSVLGQREEPAVTINNTNVQAEKAAVIVGQGGGPTTEQIMDAVARAQRTAIEEARRSGLLANSDPLPS